jgi:hypothetical protein
MAGTPEAAVLRNAETPRTLHDSHFALHRFIPAMPRQILPAALAASALAAFSAGISGCAEPVELASYSNPYSDSFAVVVSKKTYSDAGWRDVADTLTRKRRATLIVYDGDDVAASREKLAAAMPLHTAFVAKPGECGRAYIAKLHRLIRELDADPYEDTIWGVITGVDATGAKRTALATKPIVADTALATTRLGPDRFETCYMISDGKAGDRVEKTVRDGVTRTKSNDKTDAAVWMEKFESIRPKLLVTSSHGFENGFEMPSGRGMVRTKAGAIVAIDKDGVEIGAVESDDSPKVWFAAGNGPVGHVTGPEAIIPVMMSRYGVSQAAGYTVTTGNGAAGSGALAQWESLPGRYSLAEACWLNGQAIQAELLEADPATGAFNPTFDESNEAGHINENFLNAAHSAGVMISADREDTSNGAASRKVSLLWDRDTFAFYGDPKLVARLPYPKEDQPYSTHLEQTGAGRFRLSVKVNDSGAAMANTRPVCSVFTLRLKDVKVLSGTEYAPVLTDNFIMLRRPQPIGREQELVVEFEGEPLR